MRSSRNSPRLLRFARQLTFSFVLSLGLGLVPGCGSDALLGDLPAEPGIHVIVVSFDALRPDALGVYGQSRRTSPNIDAFARNAVVFDNAYSVSPLTPISFSAAFTGRYPTRVFRDWQLREPQTLASLFAAAGYQTAGFMNNSHLGSGRGFRRGFQTYEVHAAEDPDADARLLDRALTWIDSARQEGLPLFAWIHFIDPHTPWAAREESRHLYDTGYAGPSAEVGGRAFEAEDPELLAHWRTLYEGEVFALDRLFARLLEELRRKELMENTLLVLTSDHGEEFMEHGRLQHGQLTEENVRIPLILAHPELGAGRRESARVTLLDLLPTLAGLAGLESLAGATEFDGRDLRRAKGDADPIVGLTQVGAEGWQQASLRVGTRKLILECGRGIEPGARGGLQLYDLGQDPGETRSLTASNPQLAESMRRDLLSELGLEDCDGLRRWMSVGTALDGLDARARRQLRALGYIEEAP